MIMPIGGNSKANSQGDRRSADSQVPQTIISPICEGTQIPCEVSMLVADSMDRRNTIWLAMSLNRQTMADLGARFEA